MASGARRSDEGMIFVTAIVEHEDDQFVSHCRELGTTSCGDTVDEAFNALREAITVHLEDLADMGELHQFLRERNVNIVIAPDQHLHELNLPVPLETILSIFQHPLPALA